MNQSTEIQVSAHPYLAGFIVELDGKCFNAEGWAGVAAFVVRHNRPYFCDDTVNPNAARVIALRVADLKQARA